MSFLSVSFGSKAHSEAASSIATPPILVSQVLLPRKHKRILTSLSLVRQERMGRVSKKSKAAFGPAWDTFHIQERPYFETTGFYHSKNVLDEWFEILVYFEKRLFASATTPACSSQRQQTDS